MGNARRVGRQAQSDGRDEPTVYLLHIPKTGGTSLRAWLEGFFPASQVCPPMEPGELFAMDRADLNPYRLVCGHYGRFALDRLGEPVRVVTILRDPLSRTISHYRDILSRPNHPLHREVVAMGSFEAFVCSEPGEVELLNLQCRYLGLTDLEEDFHGHQALVRAGRAALWAKYGSTRLLDHALEMLEQAAVVGVCEQLEGCARACVKAFGWDDAACAVPWLNGHRVPFDPEELTGRAVARVHELTELDGRLYACAAGQQQCARGRIPSYIAS